MAIYSNLSRLYLKISLTYCEQGPECKNSFQALPEDITANGDNKPLPSASMIRSHSVSGDLHGVQPDPVAADILRKEHEQETFVRMKISPSGMTLCLNYFYTFNRVAI